MRDVIGYFGPNADAQSLHHADPGTTSAHQLDSFRDKLFNLSAHQLAANQRYVLAFAGHVDNSDSLGMELVSDGHLTQNLSRSAQPESYESQLVLAAYSVWGLDALDRFLGQWTLALWDRQENSVTLAVDHLGLHPAYLTHNDEAWMFSSRIRPLIESHLYEPAPNEEAIYRYLKFGQLDLGDTSFFEGIERLQPGKATVLSREGRHDIAYTDLANELARLRAQPRPHDDQAVGQTGQRLREAIARQIDGHQYVATRLLDTASAAAVTALTQEELARSPRPSDEPGQQRLITTVFPGVKSGGRGGVEPGNSMDNQTQVFQLNEVTTAEFSDDLRDFIRTQEEPVDSVNSYLRYHTLKSLTGTSSLLLEGLDDAWPLPDAELGQKIPGTKKSRVSMDTILDRDFQTRFSSLSQPRLATQDQPASAAIIGAAIKSAERFNVKMSAPCFDADVVKCIAGVETSGEETDHLSSVFKRLAAKTTQISRATAMPSVGEVQAHWFRELRVRLYKVYLSEAFESRPYYDRVETVHAFEDWLASGSEADTMALWRMLNVELWLQEFIDSPDDSDQRTSDPSESTSEPSGTARIKSDLEPNIGKHLDLLTDTGETARRYALRTELFSRDDDLEERAAAQVGAFIDQLMAEPEHARATTATSWYFFISEKVVAITQGRSHFLWDIKVSKAARRLSRYVNRTPAGLGLGSPFTMQMAINEAGLARVLFASVGGALGKVLGKKGVFYQLVGESIRSIDGPMESPAYPSNMAVKLAPKDPSKVASKLSATIRSQIPEVYRQTFAGTIIMDANDIGQEVLGSDVPGPWTRFERMFADNPLGQGEQQTPMAAVFVLKTNGKPLC